MERRQSKRFDREQPAMIYLYGVQVAEGTTSDLSEHGTFIRIREDKSGGALQTGALVDIVLDKPNHRQMYYYMPIEIVRTVEEGIGVRFCK